MASQEKSRWADDAEEAALEVQRKREKQLKKKANAENQRKLKQEESLRQKQSAGASSTAIGDTDDQGNAQASLERPSKRRRLSPEPDTVASETSPIRLLRFPAPEWGPCRHVDNFEKLNHIEEGTYGWVSRAKDFTTGEIVALKKLKMGKGNDGFPVTGLREIQTLMASRHDNIVALREVVMGDQQDE